MGSRQDIQMDQLDTDRTQGTEALNEPLISCRLEVFAGVAAAGASAKTMPIERRTTRLSELTGREPSGAKRSHAAWAD
jgi:hypothetical protein